MKKKITLTELIIVILIVIIFTKAWQYNSKNTAIKAEEISLKEPNPIYTPSGNTKKKFTAETPPNYHELTKETLEKLKARNYKNSQFLKGNLIALGFSKKEIYEILHSPRDKSNNWPYYNPSGGSITLQTQEEINLENKFFRAIIKEDIEEAKKIITKKPTILNNGIEIYKFPESKISHINSQRSFYHFFYIYPLEIAVYEGHKEMAEMFIKFGGDINSIHYPGFTLLQTTVVLNDKEVTELLIELGADVNYKDMYGFTPLHLASYEGNKEIIKLLLKNGADVNPENSYKEPFCKVKSENNTINITNKNSYTPLHYAVISNHKDIVELLIQNGADINSINIFDGTPLDMAKEKNLKEITKILEKYGAKESNEINSEKITCTY